VLPAKYLSELVQTQGKWNGRTAIQYEEENKAMCAQIVVVS